jgi:hypothetical protein
MKASLLNDNSRAKKPNDVALTFPKAPLSLINLMSQLNRSFRAVSWYVRSWFGRTISESEGKSWSINTKQPVRDAKKEGEIRKKPRLTTSYYCSADPFCSTHERFSVEYR